MPKTDTYSRPKSAVVNSTPIVMRVKTAEKPNAPALFDPATPAPFNVNAPNVFVGLVLSSATFSLHDTFNIGGDTYEVLDFASVTDADKTLTNDAYIPVDYYSTSGGFSARDTFEELAAAVNNTRGSYAGTYLMTDGVTPVTFKNGLATMCAIVDANVLSVQYTKLILYSATNINSSVPAPGDNTGTINVSFAIGMGMSGIVEVIWNTFNNGTILNPMSVQPPTPSYTPGTTAALDCRIQADLDPTGGTDWQDIWKVEATPSIDDTGNGLVKLAVKVTPINGDGSGGTPLIDNATLAHPQTMDQIQTAGGDPRVP